MPEPKESNKVGPSALRFLDTQILPDPIEPCDRLRIATCHGLLDGLGELLLKTQHPELQNEAAKVICLLVDVIDLKSSSTIIANHKGWMGSLVKQLHDCQVLDVQLQVADAFFQFATRIQDDSTRGNIVNFPGVLEDITGLLLKCKNPVLQMKAAVTMLFMADWDLRIADKIANQSELVDNLTKLSSEHQNSDLRPKSTKVLQKFALKCLVEDTPGVVKKAAEMLRTTHGWQIQFHIMNTIRFLMHRSDNQLRKNVSQVLLKDCPEVLKSMLEVLSGRESSTSRPSTNQMIATHTANPGVAADLLALLIDFGVDAVRVEIAMFPDLLEALVQTELPLVPFYYDNLHGSARLVAQLAATTDASILDRILASRNLVERLATAMALNEYPALQVEAERALFNLAGGEDMDYLTYVESLERLTEALQKDENKALRERVIQALTNLPEILSTEAPSEGEDLSQTGRRQNTSIFRKYFLCCTKNHLLATSDEGVAPSEEAVAPSEDGMYPMARLREFREQLSMA